MAESGEELSPQKSKHKLSVMLDVLNNHHAPFSKICRATSPVRSKNKAHFDDEKKESSILQETSQRAIGAIRDTMKRINSRRVTKFAGKYFYADSNKKKPESGDGVVVIGSNTAEEVERAKQSRRRRSFEQMNMGMTDGVANLLKEKLHELTGLKADSDPKTKLDLVLQHAKARGLSSEAIFKFFDGSSDGQISESEFKAALSSLDKLRLDLSDDEVRSLVEMFDKDADMTVSMQEFKDYCFALPGTAWKAEKIRDAVRRDSVEPAAGTDPQPTFDSVNPSEEQAAGHDAESLTTQNGTQSTNTPGGPALDKSSSPTSSARKIDAPGDESEDKRDSSFMCMTRSAIVRIEETNSTKKLMAIKQKSATRPTTLAFGRRMIMPAAARKSAVVPRN